MSDEYLDLRRARVRRRVRTRALNQPSRAPARTAEAFLSVTTSTILGEDLLTPAAVVSGVVVEGARTRAGCRSCRAKRRDPRAAYFRDDGGPLRSRARSGAPDLLETLMPFPLRQGESTSTPRRSSSSSRFSLKRGRYSSRRRIADRAEAGLRRGTWRRSKRARDSLPPREAGPTLGRQGHARRRRSDRTADRATLLPQRDQLIEACRGHDHPPESVRTAFDIPHQ